jgi:hypothetical protein
MPVGVAFPFKDRLKIPRGSESDAQSQPGPSRLLCYNFLLLPSAKKLEQYASALTKFEFQCHYRYYIPSIFNYLAFGVKLYI